MLLLDFLLKSEDEIRSKKDQIKKLEDQYRRVYDPDIKREILVLKNEIRKINSSIVYELIFSLDELRYMSKYFPDLLLTLREDQNIGLAISKKLWLLNFTKKPLDQAATELAQIRNMRLYLRLAKKAIKAGPLRLNVSVITTNYPFLSPFLKEGMNRDDLVAEIKKFNLELKKKGWLLLLNDQLIQYPLSKFTEKYNSAKSLLYTIENEAKSAKDQGTTAETTTMKALRKAQRICEHYENIIKQILLANPDYLRGLKQSKNWLSKNKTNIESIAQSITPKSVREQSWLNEMKKKLSEIDSSKN